ncbi:unnamed protein product [Paramecium primaurelia]|uniref:Uncharacterized protein n=2 Tax=Paramecium TaxID=5884 RepID=A0A8S1VTB8_9CILI|nr:unnamed protein product [Paramecium primaurelia]CAD8180620.1 unnamed protein product [Paramecium pentaurelia]
MNLINCLDLSQQIVKQIFRSKYKSKVDTNFNIECNQIRKKWNNNGQNHIVIQFYLCKSRKQYLVEEWNIICIQQQISDHIQDQFKKCEQLASQTPLCLKQDNQIDHIIHLNENKRTDWIDPSLILTSQLQLSNKVTINVAYLSTLEIIEREIQESTKDSLPFRRDRFLSDDIQQNNRLRRSTDIDGLRQYKKNKEILTKVMNRMNDSFSSTSSKNKSTQLLTIINKKDDIEILSSPEDAQKIIDEDENGDYEIQMIIDEEPIIKGQTIIIKSQQQQFHPIIDYIFKIRNKKHNYNTQLFDTMNFIKNYY